MIKGLIGKKVRMTSGYDTHGRWVPVSVVEVPNNVVFQVKDKDKDKYESAQIGLVGPKKVNKPLLGLSKKIGSQAPLILREVAFSGDIKAGEEIKVKEVVRAGELVDISGISKGKGFAGGMKRQGFHGGPRTHGQSDRSRAPGSIGSGTTPGRVYKGKKMAGHMGADNVTVRNLEVLEVDGDNNLLMVKGAVPGPNGSFVIIHKTGKKTKAYVEPEIPAVPNLGGGGSEEPKDDVVEGASVDQPAAETPTEQTQ